MTRGGRHRPGSAQTVSLTPNLRSKMIESLEPDTRYLVCVQGLSSDLRPVSKARPHTTSQASQPHMDNPEVII